MKGLVAVCDSDLTNVQNVSKCSECIHSCKSTITSTSESYLCNSQRTTGATASICELCSTPDAALNYVTQYVPNTSAHNLSDADVFRIAVKVQEFRSKEINN